MLSNCRGRDDLPECARCARKGKGDYWPLVQVQWVGGPKSKKINRKICLSFREKQDAA